MRKYSQYMYLIKNLYLKIYKELPELSKKTNNPFSLSRQKTWRDT